MKRARGQIVAPLLAVLVAGCPGRPDAPTGAGRCAGAAQEQAAARRLLAEGHLGRALRAARGLDTRCGDAAGALLLAEVLADLGLDDDARAAYRAHAARGGPDARRTADAGIAALAGRPPARRESTPADREQALLLYRAGVDLRLRGRFEASIDQLRRSYALAPTPLTIVQIGLAHQGAGRQVEARKANARALAIAELLAGRPATPRLLTSATGYIHSVSYRPQGRLLASATVHGEVTLWDLSSGREARRLERLSDATSVVAWSPDGATLISVGRRGTVRVNDAATGAELRATDLHADTITSIAYQPGGTLIAAATMDAGVALISTTDGALVRTLPTGASLDQVAFSPDGSLLAVGGGPTITLWESATGRMRSRFAAQRMTGVIAFAAAGDQVIAGDYGGAIGSWTLDGQPRVTFPAHEQRVTSLAVFGELVASTSDDGTVRLSRSDGTPVQRMRASNKPLAAAFSPDGTQLAVAGEDKSIQIWDVPAGTLARSLSPRGSGLLSLALSADGGLVITGSNDGTVKMWTLPGGGLRVVQTGDAVHSVAIAGSRVASGGVQGQLQVRDLSPDALPLVQTKLGDAWFINAALSADGRWLTSSADQATGLPLWDLQQPRAAPHKLAERAVKLPAFTAAGALVTVRDTIEVRDPATSDAPRRFGQTGGTNALALSRDGRLAALGTMDDVIDVWELGPGRRRLHLTGHQGYIEALDFSGDGAFLVSSSYDRTIKTWEVATGKLIRTIGDTGAVTGLAAHPRSRLIVGGTLDGLVKLWDGDSGELLVSVLLTEDGTWVAATPDGRVDGSPGGDGGRSLLWWQAGDVQLPGFVGWDRQAESGLVGAVCGPRCR